MSQVISGDAPAFSAYMNANQTVTANTFTKVTFNTKVFDTNSNFDTSTYRFTPTVAGYYQLNAAIYPNTVVTGIVVSIYKNGSAYCNYGGTTQSAMVSSVVYLNGSTDYVECYGYLTGTTPTILSTSYISFFNGALVRGA